MPNMRSRLNINAQEWTYEVTIGRAALVKLGVLIAKATEHDYSELCSLFEQMRPDTEHTVADEQDAVHRSLMSITEQVAFHEMSKTERFHVARLVGFIVSTFLPPEYRLTWGDACIAMLTGVEHGQCLLDVAKESNR